MAYWLIKLSGRVAEMNERERERERERKKEKKKERKKEKKKERKKERQREIVKTRWRERDGEGVTER